MSAATLIRGKGPLSLLVSDVLKSSCILACIMTLVCQLPLTLHLSSLPSLIRVSGDGTLWYTYAVHGENTFGLVK